MRVGVTGGTGFIGSHVVDSLVDAGHDTRVIDTIPPSRNDVEFVSTNIVNFEELKSALSNLDALFHLAAVSNIVNYAQKPVFSTKVNVEATVNLLEGCLRYDVDRFIFASTVWVYGAAREMIVDESTPISLEGAGHPYTTSKIASELFIQDYVRLYGQNSTILRYGIPYGPRARRGTVIPVFVERIMAGQNLTIFGDGNSGRNFIYVKDLAEGNVCALSPKAKNEVYNLDGSEEITLNRIARTAIEILGADVSVEYKEARPGDYINRQVSIEKAKDQLDWEPTTKFEEGLKLYIDWIRNQ
ncbi:MAG: NAD-dependent epimerase/dehydratase family protein [Candidatus Thorarchaeota archaeon]